MLALKLRVVKPVEFRARVMKMPRTLPMAIGSSVLPPAYFPGSNGKKEKLIMCEYDREPWLFYSPISCKSDVCTLFFYHIRLHRGADWGLPNMPIEVKVISDTNPYEYELKCETGYGAKEGPFTFQVKVIAESCEMIDEERSI